MMSSSRRKSCTACVRAKRRCDLGFPFCRRCLTRGATCVYPWAAPEPASRSSSSGPNLLPMAEQPATPTSMITRYSANTPFLQRWDDDTGVGLTDPIQLDLEVPVPRPMSFGLGILPTLFDDLLAQGGAGLPSALGLETSVMSPIASKYIQYARPPPSSFVDISDGPITTGSVYQSRTEYAARRLAMLPYLLASSGQTVFIHHTQTGASAVLQDSLAACALHVMRNPANEALVRGEISRRAARLVAAMDAAERALPLSNCAGLEMDLLPPVQALLIYQCIRLFSPSDDIASRAQAERDEPRLRAWMASLRLQVEPVGGCGPDQPWACWVRAESVRRTAIVVDMLSGVYTFLKQGWDQAKVCVGPLGFTAQSALWGARSAAEWRGAWAKGPSLEIPLDNWLSGIENAIPDDIDDLGIMIHALHVGLDALEEWLGGGRAALVKWGLRSQ